MEQAATLKVLYVITKANFGGAQRYVHDLALAADVAGHEVVVAFGGDGMLGQRLQRAGIRTVSLPTLERDVSLWADLKAFIALYRLIRDEAPDVVHLNSSKVGLLGALAARLRNLAVLLPERAGRPGGRVATVFTGHGWAFNEERSALSRLALRFMHWLTILLSHCVIAVSEATRRQVSSFPFVRKKLVVVHNGVGEIAPRDADEAWTLITNGTAWHDRFPGRPPAVIGTLAELHKNKGLGFAIDAVALLRSRTEHAFVLVIMGEGEERAALTDQIERLGLGDTVLLAGYLPNACEMLRALDVFLLSSITEAFPYALLEAGIAGLPIVASRVGGIPDLIADSDTGLLVPPRSADAIAGAILFLLENPNERTRLARHVRTRVVESFSLDRMTARTFALYRSVTDQLHGIPAPQPGPREGHRPGSSLGPSP